MKKIKISPLTKAEDLKLNVNEKKQISIDSLEKIEALNAIIAEFRAKGMEIIVGQQIAGEMVVSTQLEVKNKKQFFFPEPNPVHLFFSNAVQHFENAKQFKEEFLKLELDYNALYASFNQFFNEMTTGIIMLYTSLEAFINQHIPENFSFDIDGKILLKKDVEWLDIKEKIKNYLPIVFGIKFQVSNDKEYHKILMIREIRNDLIHLKTQLSINKTFYEELFGKLFEAKSDDFVEATFTFMNIFRPSYLIEEV